MANPPGMQLNQQQLQAKVQQALRARGADSDKRIDEAIRNSVNARPWTYWDTLILSSYTPFGNTSAVNYANVQAVTPFFKGRTRDGNGLAVSNMTTVNGQMDVDFLCMAITVEPYAVSDNGAATQSPAGLAFIEEITHNSAIEIKFGDKPVLQRPTKDLPAGGGVSCDAIDRTQAVAADYAQAVANNGMPTPQALRMLDEPIAFRQVDSFSVALHIYTGSGTNGPLARINALTALSSNQTSGIRIAMHGIRGEDLLRGTPKP